MKCSNCGGELIFQDNIGVCSSCGSNHKMESAFENTEVCICYIENDANGRRTKDSLVAAEVYKKLESKKISTFYEHISAATIIGDDLEMFRNTAISRAKIIVIVGTSTESFSVLYQKYADHLKGKKIIPLLSGIKPEQLPDELRRFQASNFDAVGALNDLSISVLNMLGRGQEVELEEIYNKKLKKKKTIIAVALSLLAALVCATAILAVVFWPEKEEPVVLTNEDIYNSAIALINEEKHLEAAIEFNKILDYKDSANQVKKIYDRYDGYYLDDESDCSLYLNIVDAKTAEISIEKTTDNQVIKIEEELVLENNAISGAYIDNLSNKGTVSIVLSNETIDLTVSTQAEGGATSMGDVHVVFEVKNKSDRSPIEQITKELLVNWLVNRTTIDDIKSAGHELIKTEFAEMVGINFNEYQLSNTSITIHTNIEYVDDSWVEDRTVKEIIAPASIVCADRIGQGAYAFVEDGILYDLVAQLTISRDDRVTMSSAEDQESVAKTIKSSKLRYYSELVRNQYKKDYTIPDQKTTHVEIVAENKDAVLALVHVYEPKYTWVNASQIVDGNYYYYKLNLKTEKSTFIVEHEDVWYSKNGRLEYSYDEWKKYPDIFAEFLDEQPSRGEYLINVQTEGHIIYTGPGYSNVAVDYIEIGTYTIVEEKTDSNGKIWGRLKSGAGWVCVTAIQG